MLKSSGYAYKNRQHDEIFCEFHYINENTKTYCFLPSSVIEEELGTNEDIDLSFVNEQEQSLTPALENLEFATPTLDFPGLDLQDMQQGLDDVVNGTIDMIESIMEFDR